MPAYPSSDKPPPKKAPVPPTLSDAERPHTTEGAPSAPTVGVVLAAGQRPLPEYELVRLLGRGGFGEVWQAKGPGGFDVALKFVRLGEKVGAAELRALELMKGVRHAHLLPLFGAWQRDGFLVVAMELADGTLLDRLARAQEQGAKGIPGKELLEYMREAAKGLDFLNEGGPGGSGEGAGIQHKDVKPQNLLLVGGTVKVADFGLARVLEHTITAASGGLTPAYAPPEFFSGQVSRWSDQYSLAISYCQLRVGRLPFGGNPVQVMAGHLTQVPQLDMLPAGERAAVARALAKKPEERWPSCRAFVAGLTAPGRKGPAPTPTGRPAPVSVTSPVVPQRAAASGGPRRWMPWLLASLLGLLTLVVVVLVVAWLSGGLLPRKDKVAQATTKPAGEPKTELPKEPGGAAPAPEPEKGKENPKLRAGPPKGPPARPPEIVTPVQGPRPQDGAPFTNSVGMKFVWIKPGTFRMGSPPGEAERDTDETPHQVTLTKGFHLAAHLVTQQQWERVLGQGANRSKFLGKDDDEKGRLPVDNVSWDDCQDFCRKLGALEGRRYRLPTEAEWEYACRAGTDTAFWWGDSITTDQANYDGNSTFGKDGKKGEYRGKTTPVDFFKPNAWGLHDMHGNLMQWCEDVYGPYGDKAIVDPLNLGPPKGNPEARVLRGGSWIAIPKRCRAAFRNYARPETRDGSYGGFGCRPVLCRD